MSLDRRSDDIGEDVLHVRAGSCLFNGGCQALGHHGLHNAGILRNNPRTLPRNGPFQAESAHPQGQAHGHSYSLEYYLCSWYVSLFSSSSRGVPPVVTSSPSARGSFPTCTLFADPS